MEGFGLVNEGREDREENLHCKLDGRELKLQDIFCPHLRRHEEVAWTWSRIHGGSGREKT